MLSRMCAAPGGVQVVEDQSQDPPSPGFFLGHVSRLLWPFLPNTANLPKCVLDNVEMIGTCFRPYQLHVAEPLAVLLSFS